MGIVLSRCLVYRRDMLTKPKTFEDVLALWVSPTELSVDLGVPYVTAQMMRRRKSIGVDHWPAVIRAAKRKGVRLDNDDLVQMRLAKSRQRKSA